MRTGIRSPSSRRAWIEIDYPRCGQLVCGSPSSRRAWIEIPNRVQAQGEAAVALLAEGVDRNTAYVDLFAVGVLSPSSRRAWIEIFFIFSFLHSCPVALLAEGVDRNIRKQEMVNNGEMSPSSRRAWIEIPWSLLGLVALYGRPPRGGRG